MLLRDPLAAPGGCPLQASGLLLGAQFKVSGFGLTSPIAPLPLSILVQVLDKNSMRIKMGGGARLAQGEARVRVVVQSKGTEEEGCAPSPDRGARGFKEVPGESIGVRHTAPTQTAAPSTPCARLLIPPLPRPSQALPSVPGQVGPAGEQRAVGLQAPERTWRSQPARGRPSLGAGAPAPTAGRRPATPHPHPLPPPKLLEIETEAEREKEEGDVKSNRKNQDSV